MTDDSPHQLRLALEEAEAIIEALQSEQVDAVVGRRSVALLRLKEVEEQLRRARDELEQRVAERTAEAERRTRQLQSLALELTEAEERERRRLAALLHDGLQQQLVAMRFQLDTLGRSCTDGLSRSVVTELVKLAEETIRTSRSLAIELSPPLLHQEGLAAALAWLAQTKSEKYGLVVRVEADEDASPADDRIKVLMFQAARELLFNVVKHAETDHARLALRRSDGEIELEVSDEGCGFDLAGLAAAADGFGLLSIRERAELLGATVEVDSAAGRGTRVSLRWPGEVAATGTPADEADRPAEPDERAASVEPERELRVLLVDDHAVVRQGLRAVLDGEDGLVVVGEADGGVEGVRAAKRLAPDVVIMDVSMPDLDGIAATRRITRENPSVRVIGLSMFDEGDARRRMIEAGAEAYVTKTAPSAELLDAIRRRSSNGR